MEHSLYLSNLPSKDIYLFLQSKSTLKGKRFQEIKDFHKNVTAALNRESSPMFLTVAAPLERV
jgi:hypothetical protein